MSRQAISFCLILSFVVSTAMPYSKAHAQGILDLPQPGQMVNLSASFEPPMIKGITIHPENPFLFDFLVAPGQDKLSNTVLKAETAKLAKYFLASLAIPDNDLWVNLSPYEKNRIVPESLGQTDMGRDLLAQDYVLKQITASLIYPEKELGKKFWDKVYTQAQEKLGNVQVPVSAFNKVWVVGDRAKIYVHNNSAMVVDAHYKVMLEQDYIALSKNEMGDAKGKSLSARRLNLAEDRRGPEAAGPISLVAQVMHDVVLPELEREVNTGKNFAALRQISNAIILASWYKKNLKEALLTKAYANQSKVNGIALEDKNTKEQIYGRYLQAFRKGVFNYVKKDSLSLRGANSDQAISTRTTVRKYFAGGYSPAMLTTPQMANASEASRAMTGALYTARVNMDPGQVSEKKVNLPNKDIVTAEMFLSTIDDLLRMVGNEDYLQNEERNTDGEPRVPEDKVQVFANTLITHHKNIVEAIRDLLVSSKVIEIAQNGFWLVARGAGVGAYTDKLNALRERIETSADAVVSIADDKAMLSADETRALVTLDSKLSLKIYLERYDAISRTIVNREKSLASGQARHGADIARDITNLTKEKELLDRVKAILKELKDKKRAAAMSPEDLWESIKKTYVLHGTLTPEQNDKIGKYKRGTLPLAALLDAVKGNLKAVVDANLDVNVVAKLIEIVAQYQLNMDLFLSTVLDWDIFSDSDENKVSALVNMVQYFLMEMSVVHSEEIGRFLVRQAGFDVGNIINIPADAAMTAPAITASELERLTQLNSRILGRQIDDEERSRVLQLFFSEVNLELTKILPVVQGMLRIMTQLEHQQIVYLMRGNHKRPIPALTKDEIRAAIIKNGWRITDTDKFDQWFGNFDATREHEQTAYGALAEKAEIPDYVWVMLNQQYIFVALELARILGAITVTDKGMTSASIVDNGDKASISLTIGNFFIFELPVLLGAFGAGAYVYYKKAHRPKLMRLLSYFDAERAFLRARADNQTDILRLGPALDGFYVAFRPKSRFDGMTLKALNREIGRKSRVTLAVFSRTKAKFVNLGNGDKIPTGIVLLVRRESAEFSAWIDSNTTNNEGLVLSGDAKPRVAAITDGREEDKAMNPGGIDLQSKNRLTQIQQDGVLDIKIDAALPDRQAGMIRQYQLKGLEHLHPNVLSLVPLKNAMTIFGLNQS